jgi:hypothetical protein
LSEAALPPALRAFTKLLGALSAVTVAVAGWRSSRWWR